MKGTTSPSFVSIVTNKMLIFMSHNEGEQGGRVHGRRISPLSSTTSDNKPH